MLLATLLVAAVLPLATPPRAATAAVPDSYAGEIVLAADDGLIPSARFAGVNRFETAGLIATDDTPFAAGFAGDAVVLARADIFPDALAGSRIGGTFAAPILLTPSAVEGAGDQINAELAAALDEIDPDDVYVLGGDQAVSTQLTDLIADAYDVEVTRFGGVNRFETAALIARQDFAAPPVEAETSTVVVANAGDRNIVDALVAGAIGAAADVPILLTGGTAPLDPFAAAELQRLAPERVLVAGGPDSLGPDVVAAIESTTAAADVERVDGSRAASLQPGTNRNTQYATAVAFAELAADDFGFGTDHVNLSRGGITPDAFADALALGPHAGRDVGGPAPIVMSASDTLSAETRDYLASIGDCGFSSLHVAGGTEALSAEVETEARTVLSAAAGQPCTVTLDPPAATNLVGETHTVTATVTDNVGETTTATADVTFTVTPETGSAAIAAPTTGTVPLVDGRATFDFTSDLPGGVAITAEVTADDGTVARGTATKDFVLPDGLVGVTDAAAGAGAGPELVLFDADGAERSRVPVTGVTDGTALAGLDVRSTTGVLYALGDDGELYTVDAAGAATSAGNVEDTVQPGDPAGTATPPFDYSGGIGFDFNPSGPNALRIVLADGTNLRVAFGDDGTIAATNVDGDLAYLAGDANEGTAPTVTSAGYRANGLIGSGQVPEATELYGIDTDLDVLVTQAPANAGTLATDGPLGLDVDAVNGFDLVSPANDASVDDDAGFAALTTGGEQSLYRVDLDTGAATLADDLGDDVFSGITTGVPFALLIPDGMVGVTAAAVGPELLVFDQLGAVSDRITLTGVTAGTTVVGIDVRSTTGVLYALGSDGELYTVDATGAASSAGNIATTVQPGMPAGTATPPFDLTGGVGFDFNPTGPNALRIVLADGTNLRVAFAGDGSIAATNVDQELAYLDGDDNAGADPAVTASGYEDNGEIGSGAAAPATELYGIDTTLDVVVEQTPANAGTLATVGPLGIDADTVNGLDVVSPANGANNAAFAALTVGGEQALYRVDFESGAAITVTDLDGETLAGLTTGAFFGAPGGEVPDGLVGVTAGPAPELVAYDGLGGVARRTPITGLVAGTALVGADVRSTTGLLYALGDDGTLSVVGANGVARGVYDLEANVQPGDPAGTATAPFDLTGGVGFDFNPTGPNALRIVLADGTNLRVAGFGPSGAPAMTFVDGDLAYGAGDDNEGTAPTVTAAGYRGNGVIGSGEVPMATELYVIDTDLDVLATQAPANAGTLATDGPLGIDVDAVNGLDLVSPANDPDLDDDAAFAVLTVDGDQSLYAIDLDTGAATFVNDLGADTLVGMATGLPADVLPAGLSAVTAGAAPALVAFDEAGVETGRVAVTGLAAGTEMVGADVRSTTGIRFALGDDGTVYTVADDGVATAVYGIEDNVLPGDPAGTATPPFDLTGGVGFDFNPTGPNALRIVLTDGTNLRVGFAAGTDTPATTFVDGDLAYGAGDDNDGTAPAATAAGYRANGRIGSGEVPMATELYVIDTDLDVLATQAPANAGTLATDGPLGIDVDAVNGLDLVSPANDPPATDDQAFAVLTVDGEAGLYRIDLDTGTASLLQPLPEQYVGIAFDG